MNTSENNESNTYNKVEERKSRNKLMRLWILFVMVLLAIISLVIGNNMKKDKVVENDVIVIEGIVPVNDNRMEHLFTQIDKFNIPNNFDKNSMVKEDNSLSIKSNDGSEFYYEEGIPLTDEEKSVYIINNVVLYSKYIDELGNKYNINIDDYIKIDEFRNDDYTFYGIGFEDNDFYKYIIINVYVDKDGIQKISYGYLKMSKSNSEYFSYGSSLESKHNNFLTEIFKNFNR